MTRRLPSDRPPPPGLKRLVTPPRRAPQVTYLRNRSSASCAIPMRSPLVSSRNLAMRPAAAPSFSSDEEPDGSPTSGSAPRTTIWSSSTLTSTPVNQPSGSLPANQPLIDPSSFSSMITTLLRNRSGCNRSVRHRGVQGAQVAAWHGLQEARALKTRLGGQPLPGRIREGVRDPGVASVRPILDDDQGAARTQHLADGFQDRPPFTHEMQRVGHHHTVKAGDAHRPREVGDHGLDRGGGKPPPHLFAEPLQRAGVAVDRRDFRARAGTVRQGEGEGAFAGAEVCPLTPLPSDPIADQGDEISVFHGPRRSAPAPWALCRRRPAASLLHRR